MASRLLSLIVLVIEPIAPAVASYERSTSMTDLRLSSAQDRQHHLRAEAHAERLARSERQPQSRGIRVPLAVTGVLIAAVTIALSGAWSVVPVAAVINAGS